MNRLVAEVAAEHVSIMPVNDSGPEDVNRAVATARRRVFIVEPRTGGCASRRHGSRSRPVGTAIGALHRASYNGKAVRRWMIVVSEVREAADFCRYYAAEGRKLFGDAQPLPGPTGERNTLRLRGRGVFAAISPWIFPLAIFFGAGDGGTDGRKYHGCETG